MYHFKGKLFPLLFQAEVKVTPYKRLLETPLFLLLPNSGSKRGKVRENKELAV